MTEEFNDLPLECQSFDDEFASLIDYAKMYRSLGLQVVPAMSPSSGKNWKRPALPTWKEFTHHLASDEQFEQFFAGHANLTNIGLLTGPCSKNLFIIDLDIHKNPNAIVWWEGIHADHNAGIMSETPTQRTGGGGLQMLFFAPQGWSPPTIKTSIGVDIRGVGGFAVVAPSRHEAQGSEYAWIEGQEPYTIPIPVADTWLCQEVDALAAKYGGHVTNEAGERVRTETPSHQTDEWGKIIDGREDRMYRMIWRTMLDLYRDSPIIPSESDQVKLKKDLFDSYVESVESRLREPGTPKHMLLEKEDRGISMFNLKWRAAVKQWDTKVREQAAEPWIYDEHKQNYNFKEKVDFTTDNSDAVNGEGTPIRPPDLFRVWDIDDLDKQPPAVFIWDGIVVEGGSHYFAAAPGIGKTFIGLGLAGAIATGMDSFLGKKVNRHGLVIYITTEVLYDHRKRLRAFEKTYGVKVPKENYLLIPDSMNLMNERDRSRLMRTLAWETKIRNKMPVMVVFDTVSKVTPGADENTQKDTTLFIKAKADIKQEFNCADLCMHHRSRNGDGAMRGSTTYEGEADGIYVFEREKGSEELTFTAAKIKAAPDGWDMKVLLKTVDLDNLDTSLVAVLPDAPGVREKHDFGGQQETGYIFAAGVKMSVAERDEILRSAKEAWDGGDPWSIASQTKYTMRYAPIWIEKVLKKRIKNDTHALLVASAFVQMGLWSNELRNSDTKIRGLKVSNMYQNGTENTRKSSDSNNNDFRENEE